jgi:Ca-activated chloride channel family protein
MCCKTAKDEAMIAARSSKLFPAALVAVLALILILPLSAQDAGQQEAGKRYARGSRELQSRILVQTERYLKGLQRLQVTDELLAGFQPDYIEFYIDGELKAIDSEPPYEASIDVGAYTAKHSILIVAVREIAVETAQQTAETAQAAGGTFKLTITNPREGTYVLGRTPISVEAEFEEEGARLETVQFFVDDEPVGTASQEPWELVYDFGRQFNGRRISVIALDNLGRRAEAALTTAPLERSAYYIETRVVTLDVIVTDDRGKLVGQLTKDDFQVLEDGAEQEIRYFSSEERPIWVAILIDTSGSMEGAKIRRSVFAAQQFINQLKPADHAMVVTFGPEVDVVSEFTNDYDKLLDKVGGITAIREALTPLNQSLYDTMEQFKDRIGRRAIIVISDGADTASKIGPDKVDEAAKSADVRIYGIGIRQVGAEGRLGEMDDPGVYLLRGLADTTGGDSYFPTSTSEFLGIFSTIAAELRSQYSMGYVPPAGDEERYRKIDVKLKKKGLIARTRKGYYPNER